MSRLHYSVKVCTAVTIIFLNFIGKPVPVDSVKHKVVFEPTKMFTQCKNSDLPPLQTYFDLSHLKFKVISDNSLQITGYVTLNVDPPEAPMSVWNLNWLRIICTSTTLSLLTQVHTTLKQKVRGRWMNVPFVNHMKDFCAIYYKEGTYWNDNITKYFVGDQRKCPPVKDVNFFFYFKLKTVWQIIR